MVYDGTLEPAALALWLVQMLRLEQVALMPRLVQVLEDYRLPQYRLLRQYFLRRHLLPKVVINFFDKKLISQSNIVIDICVCHLNEIEYIFLICVAIMISILIAQIHTANAQYTGQGTAPGSIEEQLRLAREKTSLAELQDAYQSNEAFDSSPFEINIPSEAIEALVSSMIQVKNVTYNFFIDNGTHNISFSGKIEVARK